MDRLAIRILHGFIGLLYLGVLFTTTANILFGGHFYLLHDLVIYLLFFAAIVSLNKDQTHTCSRAGLLVATLHASFPLVLLKVVGTSSPELSLAGSVMSAVGLTISALALIDLGSSFAVIPKRAPVKMRGLYALVRHPMYLGYLFLVGGTVLRHPSSLNVMLMAVFVFLTVIRIEMEERQLTLDNAYVDYSNHVRYRLLPGVH